MSKKFLPVVLVLTGASLFLAFQTQGKSGDDNPKLRYTKVLRNVGLLLEQGHYSPKKIDDSFSKLVLKKFEEAMDDDRNIFLQSDIENFKKYETRIDDEIHGGELESFFTVNDLYLKRLTETSALFKDILLKPFDYTREESVELEQDKLAYPKSEADRKETWRKRLKYLSLVRFVEMQNDQEKNKDKKDFCCKGRLHNGKGSQGCRKKTDRAFFHH